MRWVYPAMAKEGPGPVQDVGIVLIYLGKSFVKEEAEKWRSTKDAAPIHVSQFAKHRTFKGQIVESWNRLELIAIDKEVAFKGSSKMGSYADHMITFNKKTGGLYALVSFGDGAPVCSAYYKSTLTVCLPPALAVFDAVSWSAMKELMLSD